MNSVKRQNKIKTERKTKQIKTDNRTYFKAQIFVVSHRVVDVTLSQMSVKNSICKERDEKFMRDMKSQGNRQYIKKGIQT